MVTAFQIALLLILIALIGIILGYIFGRLACKKREDSLYFEKSDYCEEQYNKILMGDENSENANRDYNSDLAASLTKSDTQVREAAEETSSAANVNVQSLKDTSAVKEISESEESEQYLDDRYKPALLSEPKNGEKDNLCRIKGIGNVIEGKLNNLGIFHFEQIAAWTEDEVKWIDTHLAFSGRIIREDWIGQAKLLAQGEETEFSKRVNKGEVVTSKIE